MMLSGDDLVSTRLILMMIPGLSLLSCLSGLGTHLTRGKVQLMILPLLCWVLWNKRTFSKIFARFTLFNFFFLHNYVLFLSRYSLCHIVSLHHYSWKLEKHSWTLSCKMIEFVNIFTRINIRTCLQAVLQCWWCILETFWFWTHRSHNYVTTTTRTWVKILQHNWLLTAAVVRCYQH